MKKIVGIIAALALAGSVFAKPDLTPVITSFTGNAELQWIADLDADTYGFKNSTWVEWKIQTKSADWGGDSTSGDGLWGELNINTGGDKTWEGHGQDFGYNVWDWGPTWWRNDLVVGTAKVHFMDGDTYLNVDILKPDFQVGEIGYIRALKTNKNTNNWEDNKFGKVGWTGYDGFTVNFGVPIVDLAFAFGDDGAKSFSDGHYGFKFAATLKPIDGLNIYAGVAKNTEDNSDLALAFTVGYNYKIDDQFYIKPAVQFDMVGDVKNLSAAVLFGWGSEGQTWNHDFLTFAYTQDTDGDAKHELDFNPINVAENGTRTADGLSVMFVKNLDADASTLNIEFYDNKLLSGLDIGGITTAAAYRASGDDLGKGAAAFGLIYNNNFDIVYLTARFSFGIDLALDQDNTGVKYGLRVGTKELIANTDLYADYVGCISKYSPDANATDGVNKGKVTLGCKISF